jgi:DNA-3-methyladenine glycosylase II
MMAVSFGIAEPLSEGAVPMTSAPVRDPLADHLITPENAAFAIIDYQPSQLAGVHSMDHSLLVKNAVSTVKTIKTFGVPVVHSTVNVASGRGQPTLPELAGLLADDKPLDRTTLNSWASRDGGGTSRGEPGGDSMTRDSSRAVWLRQARSHLRDADPVLARLIDDRPDFDPRAWLAQLPPMDLFGALLFQVTGQQLSVPATRHTLARIEALFGGHLPAPTELREVDPSKLREAGLSWRKISTLRDLAGRLSDGRLNPDALTSLPDDELMEVLTAIPGIGPWTVQGALIIALQREDVVLPGDLALRKAIQVSYQLDHLPTQQEVLAVADKWRPYRSLATSYLFSAAYEPAEAPPTARHRSAAR